MPFERVLSTVAVLGLGACVVVAGTGPEPRGEAGDCGAAALQHLVGQHESVLAAMTFPAPTRIIHPGQAVTMDYLPSRLNIEIGQDGRIIRVRCG